jgi:hypothetical protein
MHYRLWLFYTYSIAYCASKPRPPPYTGTIYLLAEGAGKEMLGVPQFLLRGPPSILLLPR